MNEPLSISPANAGASSPSPMGGGMPEPSIGGAAAPVPASASVPLFGGFRGGRKRDDGLPNGSPEARAADRARDAERKRLARERDKAAQPPPPLPSAGEGMAPPPADTAAPSAGSVGAGVGLPDSPAVPWDASLLAPLVKEAVAVTEAAHVAHQREKAERAGLARELVRQIEKDVKFVPAFVSTINTTAPRALAKLLNRSGVSGEYSDETLLGLAVVSLWLHGRRQSASVDKLIASAKPAEEKKP